ncbi:unnamed protein product, partial [Coffea canephora]
SRSEKKSRKAMLKLEIKAISSVRRVTVKKSKNPDVFKSPTSDTYVIFGEAKIEDLSSQLQTQTAEQFKARNLSNVISKPEPSKLVMTQVGVSGAKAVKTLKAADGDIVTTIMELTN